MSYIGLVRSPIDREMPLTNFDFQRGYIEQAKEYKKQAIVSNLLLFDNLDQKNLQEKVFPIFNGL